MDPCCSLHLQVRYTSSHIRKQAPRQKHACMHTTITHTLTRTRAHTHTHTHTNTHTHTLILTRHKYTNTHTCTHTYIHTHAPTAHPPYAARSSWSAMTYGAAAWLAWFAFTLQQCTWTMEWQRASTHAPTHSRPCNIYRSSYKRAAQASNSRARIVRVCLLA